MNEPRFPPDTHLPCTVLPSPNHGDRKGKAINAIVLHYTGMPTAEDALRRLRDPSAEVSSHYVVDEHGDLFQLVAEDRRAWHAGRSFWQGERDMNSVSIGIEIANAGHDGGLPPFPDRQIATVIALCQDIIRRWNVPAARILAHSDIAPGRKIDPGERFPWHRLAEAGVGLWETDDNAAVTWMASYGACGSCIAALQQSLSTWGYDVSDTGLMDKTTISAIGSFQNRFFASSRGGIADSRTQLLLDRLLQRCIDPGEPVKSS